MGCLYTKCLFSFGLSLSIVGSAVAQSKYVLPNGHLNVKKVVEDVRSKDPKVTAAAYKAARTHKASAVADLIAYLDTTTKQLGKVDPVASQLLLGYGAPGKPYLLTALTKGSNVARVMASSAIFTCTKNMVHPEYVGDKPEFGKGKDSWVFDADVKLEMSKATGDKIADVRAFSVATSCYLGSKNVLPVGIELLGNKNLIPYLRWTVCSGLLDFDARNSELMIAALKDLIAGKNGWFDLMLIDGKANETAYQFFNRLLKPELYSNESDRKSMLEGVMRQLCRFRRLESAELARKYINSKQEITAQIALKLLGASAGESAIDELIEFTKSTTFGVRDGALVGLGYTRSPKAVAYLKSLIAAKDEVTASAIEGLGKSADVSQIEFLLPFQNNEDRIVANAAWSAIRELKLSAKK